MIKSLLVANRGEIACRIFRTARRLGVHTIAVFSDADAGAQHVREADEAYRIGPAAPRESYLNIERVLEAARATGAEAIHPGYGFLSEKSEFAQACVDAGLVFVGPPPAAIASMGSKIVAKARMRAAGVPVLPGYDGSRQDLEHLARAALELGLPLIIKPAAGGGGKGMRIVKDKAEIADALAGARRLAESAFGDSALLLERYLPAPRHVEVQVFADTHGNFVHLGDRDCSIQRRHQKLIEEAPAPAIPDEVRSRLRAAALTVAREIGYVSAGTVEFLFDGRDVYFMEMNTRLQVEHTVTEAVTGLDLVEWQLRVASGEPLPLSQEDIRLHGHAIEARVCAEDPERDFLPSAGDLRLLQWPSAERYAARSIRVDAGFTTGDVVPASYDSLLGKVIAWAPERTQAAARLSSALEHLYCAGVHTNERWLSRVLRAPRFLEVRHSIAFLQENGGDFAGPKEIDAPLLALAAIAAHGPTAYEAEVRSSATHGPGASAARHGSASFGATAPGSAVGNLVALANPVNPWAVLDGFTPNLPARVDYTLSWHGHEHTAEMTFTGGHLSAVSVDERAPLAASDLSFSGGLVAVCIEKVRLQARYFRDDTHLHLWSAANHWEVVVEDPRLKEFSSTAAQGGLTTPLPGVVAAVVVKVGQAVRAGETLMVIEAMKMEHSISAPYDGTVKVIHFAPGDRVPEGSQLLELAPVTSA
ncbi:MAG TPA: biotin carboxylase N-terminal domain-containing protein [Steroidobacteraceae bacterium]|nr:biotin carboxylase N-terminal domain-containing protein [Steroidobacteraceae bacterium]